MCYRYQNPACWQDARLFNHTLKGALDLLTASIDLTRGGHAAKGKAAASRDATLLALVVIVILLSSQGIPGSNDGFGIAPRVAQILTPNDIGIGKHAEIVPF